MLVPCGRDLLVAQLQCCLGDRDPAAGIMASSLPFFYLRFWWLFCVPSFSGSSSSSLPCFTFPPVLCSMRKMLLSDFFFKDMLNEFRVLFSHSCLKTVGVTGEKRDAYSIGSVVISLTRARSERRFFTSRCCEFLTEFWAPSFRESSCISFAYFPVRLSFLCPPYVLLFPPLFTPGFNPQGQIIDQCVQRSEKRDRVCHLHPLWSLVC